MTYAYNSKIYLAEAVLNVKDLARQTAFYTQMLGLEILSQTEVEVLLGAGGKPSPWCISFKRIGPKPLKLAMVSITWPFSYLVGRIWRMSSNIWLS